MTKFLVTLAAASLLATVAHAADLPRPVVKAMPAPVAPASWTGFYVGVNAGYGWQNERMTVTGGNPLSSTIIGTGIVPSTFATDGDGWLIGATLGYNWNYGWGVLGIEGDIQFADISGKDGTSSVLGAFSVTTAAETKTDWLATIRARAGVFVGSGLLYATGGAAFGDVTTTMSATLATPIPAFNASALGSKSEVKTGWTVGGGYETPLWQNWTAKFEYLYIDLGSDDVVMATTVAGAPLAFTGSVDHKYHVTRAGLNYRF
jgi:outer membrane immunogenic protein